MSTMPTLEIRNMSVEELVPAPYNPRKQLKPGDRAYAKLAASLREFGLVEPLIWNETTGHVVGGHTRLRILREMGVKSVPVYVVHLTPAREKSLNVVLNNREAQGQFDSQKLADLLTELEDCPEFEMTGFEESDLRAFRFEPVKDVPVLDVKKQIEITLLTEPASYERFAKKLDKLIRDFDLECHIKGL